jgi:hypothetical protein
MDWPYSGKLLFYIGFASLKPVQHNTTGIPGKNTAKQH